LPGVRSAALTDARPPNYWFNSDTFQVDGIPWNEQTFPSSPQPDVSDGYFETLGIPLLRGRTFNQNDTPDTQVVGIISAELARRYFPDADPIGHYMHESGPGSPNSRRVEIVGVVADVPYSGLRHAPEPVFYEPMSQSVVRRVTLVVNSDVDPHSLAPTITQALQGADPDLVVGRVATLAETLSEAVNEPRFLAQLVGAFAILALLLAVVGLYGVISYLVGQRTHEIGVRMALGAQPRQVLAMVIARGAALALGGIVIGAIAALLATRVLTGLLFNVNPTDPATFTAVAALLAVIALAACYVPARRATRVDPMIALRYE
jgi:putative ABC transport system permease protein